jgi:hypothetical protein
VGFELIISAGERLKTYALDRAATGTGSFSCVNLRNIKPRLEKKMRKRKKARQTKETFRGLPDPENGGTDLPRNFGYH